MDKGIACYLLAFPRNPDTSLHGGEVDESVSHCFVCHPSIQSHEVSHDCDPCLEFGQLLVRDPASSIFQNSLSRSREISRTYRSLSMFSSSDSISSVGTTLDEMRETRRFRQRKVIKAVCVEIMFADKMQVTLSAGLK